MDIHMEKQRLTEIKVCPRLYNWSTEDLGVKLSSSLSKACALPKSLYFFPQHYVAMYSCVY